METRETTTETKSYGWAWSKVDCDFTNSMGILTHYNGNKMYELGADDITPEDDAAKHFIFAPTENKLQHAVSEYKRINKLM